MRMYWAKQRAVAPLLTALPATEQVGMTTFFSPASAAAALMAAGVMSSEPTIFSAARLLRTVLRPLAPMTIDATPKTIRTALAAIPA